MKNRVALLLAGAVGLLTVSWTVADDKPETKKEAGAVLKFKMDSLDGKPVDLTKYKGKVVLVVNVASKCGYTPQYKGLEGLHEAYVKEGLVVLGFPCNQFGKQEPGSSEEIAEFCEKNYGVKFDMFSKVDVNGEKQCDLYKFLTSKESNPQFAGAIKWNFEKFLISRDGNVVARFESKIDPQSDKLQDAIKAELAKK
jgi:glutathione peroxidase